MEKTLDIHLVELRRKLAAEIDENCKASSHATPCEYCVEAAAIVQGKAVARQGLWSTSER